LAIINEILKRPNLKTHILKRMPFERFNMLCKFDPDRIDTKTNQKMMEELYMINLKGAVPPQKVVLPEKKWWQFWK